MQNLVIRFPDDLFKLKAATLTINSKLSIHGVKSTFSIEEDTIGAPCTLTNDYLSPATQVISFRVPSEISESFTLTFKRSVVKKSESLKLQFDYRVGTDRGILDCSVCPLITLLTLVFLRICRGCRRNSNSRHGNPTCPEYRSRDPCCPEYSRSCLQRTCATR
jgi:hypothetical protein